MIKESQPAAEQLPVIQQQKKVTKSADGIIIEGIDNCLVKFSRCCDPLPGDDIIGFITRGHGVSIHKRDCSNVPLDISKASEPERWIPAHWDNVRTESFATTLQINAIDREGMVIDVMNTVYNMRIGLHSINAKQNKDGNCTVIITINAENVEHLRSIIARLEKISGVFHIERLGQ